MKSVSTLVLAGVVVLSMAMPVSALDLLGGLVKLGTDSSKSNDVVSVRDDNEGTSVGLLGKNGVSVNLPKLGSSNNVPLNTNVKVPGIASVTTGNTSNGGITVIVDPGNGGGGGGGGVLPRVNNTVKGLGGRLGNSLPSGLSSKLQWLLQMLEERNHLALANGNAVCLSGFDTAEIGGMFKRSEWDELQQIVAGHAQDIYMARKMLAACRNPQQRAALDIGDLNRVIGIDFAANGQAVLYMM